MDAYIIEADKLLCSQSCPCNLNRDIYSPDTNISSWIIGNEKYNAKNFQSCDKEFKNIAYQNAAKNDPAFGNIKDFKQNNFHDFMARIEKEFQCTGWCQTSYVLDVRNHTISKYLFTDINE